MSMPSSVRHINETRLVETLFRTGAMSRAELARALGLTRATAGNLVSRLMKTGMLMEGEKPEASQRTRTGRPGDYVQLNPNYATFLGVDLGIGQLTVVALDFNAHVLMRKSQSLKGASHEPRAIVKKLATLVEKVIEVLKPEQALQGLAVTVPGLLNHNGDVFRAPILGWFDVKLMEMLRAEFSAFANIQVENDANAAAFAELYRTREKSAGNAVYLFMDAGVGGGVFSKGDLLTGHSGYAGELGHILVGESGFGPLLTLKGSLESYIGREAVMSRYKHHHGGEVSLDELIQALHRGEKNAVSTFKDCAHYLARGLSTLTSVLNPQKFVLGGPVAGFFSHDPKFIQTQIAANLLPHHPLPELHFSPLGSYGPAIGAACLMHREFLSMDESLVLEGSHKALSKKQRPFRDKARRTSKPIL